MEHFLDKTDKLAETQFGKQESVYDIGDEYYFTAKHKNILLKYLIVNTKILEASENCEEYINLMCNELNEVTFLKSNSEWMGILKAYVNFIQNQKEDIIFGNNAQFTIEDKKLKTHLRDIQYLTELTQKQLSCILDHLEDDSDSPALWKTITLKLENLNGEKRSEIFWQRAFEKTLKRICAKKALAEQLNMNTIICKNLILSNIEVRLLKYTNTKQYQNYTTQSLRRSRCRVCLIYRKNIINIFSDNDKVDDGLTIDEKLNQCISIQAIRKNDGYPQFICSKCLILLDNAFKFKKLVENSDQELRKLTAAVLKKEIYTSPENSNDFKIEYLDEISVHNTLEEESVQNFNKLEYMEDNCMTIEQSEQYIQHLRELVPNDDDDTVFSLQIVDTIMDNDDDDTNNASYDYDNNVETDYENNNTNNNYDLTKNISEDDVEYETNYSKGRPIKSTNGGILQCETCGIISKNKATLKIHMKTHSDMKPHQCNDCGKDFKTTISLKIHMRSHTGERPYVCETCGKAFKTCSAVTNHRAIHSDVKEFPCPHCTYRACTKANLKIHDRTHSGVQPYRCRYCELKFSTASNMHKHIRNIHQKLKTHKCDQCHRSFFSRESARKHMVTHTGLKPYLCTECPMTYGWYNGLQKHMKIQHPGIKMPTEKSFID